MYTASLKMYSSRDAPLAFAEQETMMQMLHTLPWLQIGRGLAGAEILSTLHVILEMNVTLKC